MAFFPKNIFHISNTYNFERKFLGYWIEIFGYWKIVFGSIASYFYYFPLSVSYRYGNLYRPIPITIPIRHFPYRQNRYICRYRYIGRYRYRNCIGRSLIPALLCSIFKALWCSIKLASTLFFTSWIIFHFHCESSCSGDVIQIAQSKTQKEKDGRGYVLWMGTDYSVS